MKNKIFINQLRHLLILQFKSSLFYIIGILFPIICSVNFYIRYQSASPSGTTDLLLFFSIIPFLCSVAIPALCYKNSNYCYEDFVPLNKLQKILTFYFSSLISFTIILFFTSLCTIPVVLFGNFDFGKYFTSFLCLIFLGSAIISFCIFINEIITSQISALLVSILFLFIFNITHLASVYFTINNFFSNLLKFTSFAWHFDAAGKGIIDTRDILWLLFQTILFVLLTTFVSLKKNEYHNISLKFTGLIVLLFLLMLNSSRYFLRFDLSANKTYSLSNYSKTLIKEVKSPLKITYYRSGVLNQLYPQIRDITDFLNSYSSHNSMISYQIKNPDKDSTIQQLLEEYNITSQQMRTVKNNSTEFVNVYSSIVLEYAGNYEVIPFSLSADSLEYDLDVKILHLISGKSRIVNILIGNGMNFYEDYSYVIPWLTSQGFTCNPLFINSSDFEETLSDLNGLLLIIGDSEVNISQAIAIENYILQHNEKAVFCVSPYSININDDWNVTENPRTNLIEILENWGIQFTNQICSDISCSTITMYSHETEENPFAENSTHGQILNYPFWINALPQENCTLGATFFWPVKLELLSKQVSTYVISTPSSYSFEIDRNSPSKIIETNPFLVNSINISNYPKSSNILAAKITGPLKGLFNASECENSELIVIPDQYFLSTLMNGYNSTNSSDFRNFEFITNVLLTLNNEQELAILQSKTSTDTSFYKVSTVLDLLQKEIVTYILVYLIIPLLFTVFSVCLLKILKSSFVPKDYINEK